jgi:hypothetical protein
MGKFAAGQFIDLRDYLVKELITHVKEIRANPTDLQAKVELLGQFPETLCLLKEVGQEEGKLVGDRLAIFESCIDRCVEQINALRKNIVSSCLTSAQVMTILCRVCVQIRLLMED